MERKNTMLLTVIAVATLLVAVVGATFAYFTATSTNEGTSSVTVNTEARSSSSTTATAVTLTVPASNMNVGDGSNEYTKYTESATAGNVSYSVINGSTTSAQTCTYSVTYTPNVAFTKSAANNTSLKEYTLMGTVSKTNATIANETFGTAGEYDLTVAGSTKQTLASGSITVQPSATGSVTYSLKARYYNLALNQDDNSSKTFSGNVQFELDANNCTFAQ